MSSRERNSLLDLYFKVILPSVTYALPIWGCCTNKNEFNPLESIHCRAVRVIQNLTRDMPSVDVRKTAKWDSLFDTYEVKIATLIYKIYNYTTPPCLEHLIQRKESSMTSVTNIVLAYNVMKLIIRKTLYHTLRGSIAWNL